MAWNRLQSASATVDGGTSVTVTYTTANASAGTKLISAIQAWNGSALASITSVQDAALNSETPLSSIALSDSLGLLALYAMDTPSGDVGIKPAIKVKLSASDAVSVIVQEVS